MEGIVNSPSPQSILSSWGSEFFSVGDSIPILGPLSNALDKPLPLINKSVADLLGITVPELPSLPDLSALSQPYTIDLGAGGTLTIDATTQAISALIHGQYTNLITYTAAGTIPLLNINDTIPLYSLGVPGIASAEIDAVFGVNASMTYDISMGIDSDGFWIHGGSPSDPLFALTVFITAGLQGQVEVFGLPLAKAGGNLGFQLSPYV